MAQANANSGPHPASHSPLDQAAAAARVGRTHRARAVLARLVRDDPTNAQAWVRLAELTADPRQARAYARQALRVAPHYAQAIRLLRHLEARLAQPHVPLAQPKTPQHPHRRGLWLWVCAALLVLGLLALGAWASGTPGVRASWMAPTLPPLPTATATETPAPTPTPTQSVAARVHDRVPALQEAWDGRDWPAALQTLAQIAELDAAYPGLADAQCDTYVQWARDLADQGEIGRSRDTYGRALPVCAERAELLAERALALAYLSGRWRYEHGDWQSAAAALQQVYDLRPEYGETRALLYTSYISSTHQLLSAGQLRAAQQAAQSAQAVQPDSAEARDLLQQIRVQLAPTPTPTPTGGGKRIEVNISEQRMYVWEGGRLVYKWVCSTGEPGRGTAPGRYRILDKIPEAWASTWGLRMPYWMGIYWAGSLENGIHALPINRNGTTLWAGYLGTPVSYGCIILSTENARTLYNWAPVGTPVWVHY